MSIYSRIQRKVILMHPKRSMGEQRKESLISAQINWEPGVEITPLKEFSPPIGLQKENIILMGK